MHSAISLLTLCSSTLGIEPVILNTNDSVARHARLFADRFYGQCGQHGGRALGHHRLHSLGRASLLVGEAAKYRSLPFRDLYCPWAA